jgi:transposase
VKTKLILKLLEVCSMEEVSVAMSCTPLGKGYIRLRAIHDLMYGLPREYVQKVSRKSRRSLNTWIKLFLTLGIDGLINKPKPGRPRLLKDGKIKDKLIELLEEPNDSKNPLYTAVKIHAYLKEKYKVQFSYRSFLRYLHEENFNLRVPRRIPNGGDETKRNAFKIRLETLSKDDSNEIWFSDESGFEGIAGTNRAEIVSHSWKRYELTA